MLIFKVFPNRRGLVKRFTSPHFLQKMLNKLCLIYIIKMIFSNFLEIIKANWQFF